MITVFIAVPSSKEKQKLLALAPSMDTLPTFLHAVEVYAVRCSESTAEEARELLSREHTAEKALGVLRRQAHSFTFAGNV